MKKKAGIWAACITGCVIICFYLTSCGTLGRIGYVTYFPLPKEKVQKTFDSLFSTHPEYKVPANWKVYDNWSERGFGFLESRIVYFNERPREMYYITFIDDGLYASKNKTGIGIRAVCIGDPRWLLEKDLDKRENERVEKRFEEEIVSKLEKYGKCKTWRQ